MFDKMKKGFKESDEKYSKVIGDVYSLHNPYVSTGVMKSKVADFINNLKDEGIVDNFEPLNEYKGFSIHIEDINKHHAFFEYIKHNLISGADWAMMGKDFVLFYAFESR